MTSFLELRGGKLLSEILVKIFDNVVWSGLLEGDNKIFTGSRMADGGDFEMEKVGKLESWITIWQYLNVDF